MNKEINYVGTALAVNIAQLIFCFILYIVGSIINLNNFFFAAIILVVELFIWFVCGVRFAVGKNDIKKRRQLILGIVYALSPIIIVTVITVVVALLSGDQTGWNHFFFLGSPLVFYNRPALLVSRFISGNAYIVFFINYVFLAIAMFLGGNFGMILSGATKKRKRRKKESKNRIKETTPEVIVDEAVKKAASEPTMTSEGIDHIKIMEETVEITRDSDRSEVNEFGYDNVKSISQTATTSRETPQMPTIRHRPMPKRERMRRKAIDSTAFISDLDTDEAKKKEKRTTKIKSNVEKKKNKDPFDEKQVRIEDFINND